MQGKDNYLLLIYAISNKQFSIELINPEFLLQVLRTTNILSLTLIFIWVTGA